MSSDSSSSIMTSPVQQVGVISESARTRNAQAQADLRARRKAYMTELESSNSSLTEKNRELENERLQMQEQIGLLKGQVKTLKETLGMRATAATGVDSLLAAVEAERSKVRRLRGAIRKVAAMEGQDSDSEEERDQKASLRKRTRTLPSSSSAISGLDSDRNSFFSLKQDIDSVTTFTASSLSPTTPPHLDVASSSLGNHWSQTKLHDYNEEEDSSRSALHLLLAQSTHFKRRVVEALTQDIQTSSTTVPQTAWQQWLPTSPPDITSKINPQVSSTSQTKAHDEMLDRFLSAIATGLPQSGPTEISTAMLNRPSRGHFHSASIFLELFSSSLGSCCQWGGKGKGGRVVGGRW